MRDWWQKGAEDREQILYRWKGTQQQRFNRSPWWLQRSCLDGKGIGLAKSAEILSNMRTMKKMLSWENDKEQSQLRSSSLMSMKKMVDIANDVIYHIAQKIGQPLNEHIHVALTDHIAFAVKRLEKGFDMKNPFLLETESLYPKEYESRQRSRRYDNEKSDIQLPEGEIVVYRTSYPQCDDDRPLSEVNQHSQLISSLSRSSRIRSRCRSTGKVWTICGCSGTCALRSTGLNGTSRFRAGKINVIVENGISLCYNTAWKMIKILQQALKKPVHEAEAVYLTLHLYRLTNKIS